MRDLAIISKIALEATSNKNFDEQMNNILKIIGEYLQVSRSYIFIDDGNNKTISNAYEWCEDGISPQIENNQCIPYEDMPSLKSMLMEECRIKTEDISKLPKDLYEMMKAQEIVAIAIYPIFLGDKFHGFIGFDECRDNRRWYKAEIEMLETVSIILSNVFEKHYMLDSVQRYKDNFEIFFKTVEEFIIITNLDGKILEANEYVLKTLGYDYDEIIGKNITELHDEYKLEEVKAAFDDAINKRIDSCNLEFFTKDGYKVPVETRTWLGNWDEEKCVFIISKNISKEQEALQKFTKLFENNPSVMSLSTFPKGKIVDVNKAFTDVFGYDKVEVIGKTIEDIGIQIEADDLEAKQEEFNKNGKLYNQVIRVISKNNKVIDGLMSGEIIESQGAFYYLSVFVDITEQKKLQDLYNTEKKRLESIIDSTRLGTWEWDIATGNVSFNKQLGYLIGYKDNVNNIDIYSWMKLLAPEDLEKSKRMIKDHFTGKEDFYEIDCRLKHKDGSWVWVNNRGKVIEWDKNGKPLKMYGTHMDVTEKKKIENKLKDISIRDSLTNIYNRRYIFERMDKDLERSKRENTILSVAILDIDRFKKINDTFGHIVGDYILKEVTKLISYNLRPYDLLGRYGGEEFIIIMYDADKEEANRIVSRILDIIRDKSFEYGEFEIKFTFSAGISDVSELDRDTLTNERIIALADDRLYKAKRTGRNKISYF